MAVLCSSDSLRLISATGEYIDRFYSSDNFSIFLRFFYPPFSRPYSSYPPLLSSTFDSASIDPVERKLYSQTTSRRSPAVRR